MGLGFHYVCGVRNTSRILFLPAGCPITLAGGAESTPVNNQSSPEAESQCPDEELIRLIGRNESRALADIYDRYSRLVFSLALKTLCDRASAEEVVQEVFTKVWSRASEFDPARGTVLGWLVGIAHHQCIDELRRRSVRPMMAEHALVEKMSSNDLDPFASVAQTVARQDLLQALALIPQEQRLVIEYAFFQGLTQSQIAAHLHLPLGTIKTRLRLGMQKLKG